jgi:hypothetical protein
MITYLMTLIHELPSLGHQQTYPVSSALDRSLSLVPSPTIDVSAALAPILSVRWQVLVTYLMQIQRNTVKKTQYVGKLSLTSYD